MKSYYNNSNLSTAAERALKEGDNHKFVSDWDSYLVQVTFLVGLCGIVALLGMITNVINIIVFVKQGAHRQSGIVNLLGLAISDFMCVASTFYNSFCFAVLFIDPPNIPWDPYSLMYITSAWPHLMFAQITRGVTAYVAFERCICVVYPFKVKRIFTPTRSIAIIVCIFLAFLISHSPVFITQQLKYRTDPITNVTKLVLVSSSNWVTVVDIMWYINSVLFNQGSVAVVLISTLITVSRVRLSKTWRDSMAGGNTTTTPIQKTLESDQNDKTNSEASQKTSNSKLQKERKLITMITLISFIFLTCYIPDLMFFLMYTFHDEIRVAKKYNNLAWVMYSLTFFMETLNSSINILVYYYMSSKYKEIFRRMMGLANEN